MTRYVAFLRGMNLGGRRVTNDELCGHFRGMGFGDVSAFLASGNVIFSASRGDPATIARRIERGLDEALGYDVPTFLRTAEEVAAIARHEPFPGPAASGGGKTQVALLGRKPGTAARAKVLAMATGEDRLAIRGRELYWRPAGKLSDSPLDPASIEAALGPMTMRAQRTLERIAAGKMLQNSQ